jgi:hypothetical protein
MQQGSTGPRLSDPTRPSAKLPSADARNDARHPLMRHTCPRRNELCAGEYALPVAKPVLPNVATAVPSAQRGARSIVSDPWRAPVAPYRRTNALRP